MKIVERLINKKNELEERLGNLYHGGSQRKETLEYKINKLNELISAYQANPLSLNLIEAERILDQQIGFTEQKKKILNGLKLKKTPSCFFLVGSPGVGKTTFAQLLARALNKQFFSISLGGLSDSSLLLGSSESSSGNEVGLLTKALLESKTSNPLILLDEIDKVVFYKGDSAIHSCLGNILDPEQNQEITDHYLDIKLDFSQVTFLVTANDSKKIPSYLLSRASVIVELSQYDIEQKKEIASQFIKTWFDQNPNLSRNKFEITDEALITLISKTKEKGVRQLKSAIDNIFEYYLLQLLEDSERKIKIDSDLVHKIIPNDFFNIDLEGREEISSSNENFRNQSKFSQENSLDEPKNRKVNQGQLSLIKFNSLLVLGQVRKHFSKEEYQGYEKRINSASTQEEIEIVEKDFLSKINLSEKNPFIKKRESEKAEDRIKKLEEKIRKMQREITEKERVIFVTIIFALIIWSLYGMFKTLKILRTLKERKRI